MFSADNFIFASPVFGILAGVSLLLCYLEYRLKYKRTFALASAVIAALAVLLFLYFGAGIGDYLLYLLTILAARLGFQILSERRENK